MAPRPPVSISVVVPVRDEMRHTSNLYACLARQQGTTGWWGERPDGFDRLFILNDGSGARTNAALERLAAGDPRVVIEDTAGLTIYEAWNRGYWLARRATGLVPGQPWHVLVTNNDVLLPPHALAAMSAALMADESRGAAYPDFQAPWSEAAAQVAQAPRVTETRGVWGSGGMLGFCFMLAGDRIKWRPLVQDLTYRWWYGDNHLARTLELAGLRQVRVDGLAIRHVQEGTARRFDLSAEKVADREWWERTAQVYRSVGPRREAARGMRVVQRRDWRRPRDAS